MSAQEGTFWTMTDPRTIPNFRAAAGLPDSNTGDSLVIGTTSYSAVSNIAPAAPADGQPGGGIIECRINPNDVKDQQVIRLNPSF